MQIVIKGKQGEDKTLAAISIFNGRNQTFFEVESVNEHRHKSVESLRANITAQLSMCTNIRKPYSRDIQKNYNIIIEGITSKFLLKEYRRAVKALESLMNHSLIVVYTIQK